MHLCYLFTYRIIKKENNYIMKKFKIILKINNYCNYSCSYCIADIPHTTKNNYQNMDYKLLRLMVANINKYLPDYEIIYKVQGGEPTLHPYLNEIITLLYQTKHISRIRILTNSSIDFNKIIKFTFPIEVGISIHYQEMLKHGFDKSLNIILDNIKYTICNLSKVCSLNLLVDDNFPVEAQDYIINEYIVLMKKLGSIPNYAKMPIVPTKYYTKDTFDSELLENAFNKYGNTKKLYPYRGIDVETQFSYGYNCNLIHNNNHNMNILLHKAWSDIIRKLDYPLLCNNKECACAVCLDVEE